MNDDVYSRNAQFSARHVAAIFPIFFFLILFVFLEREKEKRHRDLINFVYNNITAVSRDI